MKKIYYLFAFVALAFTACQKEPVLQSSTPLTSKQTLTITLQQSDYAELASGYPKTTFTIDNLSDANYYIPQILNAEYLTAANGSTAKVTYTVSSLYFKTPDSLYSSFPTGVSYKLTNADYLLLTGNKYTDFSPAQMLEWMDEDTSVYQTSVNDQLAVVTFTPYPSTLTPPVPYSYVRLAAHAWQQAYTIQPAQYTQAGVGKYDQFTSSNTEASLVSTFSYFLKNDFTIMDTIKKNDLVFVSFGYYTTTDIQRVKPLQYDGNNFVAPYTSIGTATFIKANGSWKAQPIITLTLSAADETLIANSSYGTASQRSDLASYGDFDSSWTIADLNNAMILVLTKDVTTPQTGTNYNVIYKAYIGGTDVNTTLVFQWSGTAWVAQQQ